MKISVVTPNFNGAAYLPRAIESVLSQRSAGIDVEYIVADGGSTDNSLDILSRYASQINRVITGPDTGPANAVNRGLAAATGDILGWLNADDEYCPGALSRVATLMERHPAKAVCFGHCPIIDETGNEIRKPITRFKECFYPIASRFTLQCINYISQPAAFFRRSAFEKAGPIREDLKAAWYYELFLRLHRHGGAIRLPPPPIARFRWHPTSISGQHFRLQLKEEFEVAAHDAGRLSIQTLTHWFVRWGIVSIYSLMQSRRQRQ
jgi:glycosyltransferase involved in cell wall biosynthesis